MNMGEPSQGLGQQGAWKSIWNFKVPNRVKTFNWRACKDILPTFSNMESRKIVDVVYVLSASYTPNLLDTPSGTVKTQRMYGSKVVRRSKNYLPSLISSLFSPLSWITNNCKKLPSQQCLFGLGGMILSTQKAFTS